jgi:hypothetical protein
MRYKDRVTNESYQALEAEIAELTSIIEDISVNNDRLEDRVEFLKIAVKKKDEVIDNQRRELALKNQNISIYKESIAKKDEVIAVYQKLLHEERSQSLLNSNDVKISMICRTPDGDVTVKANGIIKGTSYANNILKSIDINARELTYTADSLYR